MELNALCKERQYYSLSADQTPHCIALSSPPLTRWPISKIGCASTQEWNEDPAALRAWQRGRTGFPLVDAGMRQLWATGWMQQSIRMVCAGFLTEYLNLHWVHGCRCVLCALLNSS